MTDILPISPAAFALIVDEETGGQAYYDKTEIHPDWPGGASGVTIGIGYDCGYSDAATIRADWGSLLPQNAVDALASVAGITGSPAHSHAQELRWISVPWEQALAVFSKIDVPKWSAMLSADRHNAAGENIGPLLPNCDKLSPTSFGVLVSVAFNRGASFDNAGDRYAEMRAIKAHMTAGAFDRIPADILAMRRLWPQGGDLWRRRGHEADLFTKGLTEGTAMTQPDASTPAPAPSAAPAAGPAPAAPWIVFDTNRNTFDRIGAIRALSPNVTVIRYLAAGLEANEKVIKQGEAHALAAANIRLGLVYEIGGRPSGAAVGSRDGAAASRQARAVGAPTDGTAILWYTVDWDAGEGDMPGIKAAFAAFKASVDPAFRVGAYASGAVCDELYAAELISARWITDSLGFRGSRAAIAAGRYELRQLLPRSTAGLDTDPDVVRIAANGTTADIGDFLPFATDTSPDPVYPEPGQGV